jgi:hypothetical protein
MSPGARRPDRKARQPVTSIEYASGHLLFHRSGRLLAQRLDESRGQLTGEPIALAYALAIDAFQRLMRRVLVDHARSRGYQERGGGAPRVSLREHDAATRAPIVDVLALDEALERLARVDARSLSRPTR